MVQIRNSLFVSIKSKGFWKPSISQLLEAEPNLSIYAFFFFKKKITFHGTIHPFS